MGEYHCKPQYSYANVISWSCQENYAQAWVVCEWVIFVFAKAACAPGGRVCLILLAVWSQFLSWMCQEKNVFITEYFGDAQIPGWPLVVWDVCVCVWVCVSVSVWGHIYMCVDVFIRGADLGCLLLLGSYHFMGHLLTFRILNSSGLAIIYETIWHSVDKRKCSGISLWTLKLILCFYKKKITLFNWISSVESPFYMF